MSQIGFTLAKRRLKTPLGQIAQVRVDFLYFAPKKEPCPDVMTCQGVTLRRRHCKPIREFRSLTQEVCMITYVKEKVSSRLQAPESHLAANPTHMERTFAHPRCSV